MSTMWVDFSVGINDHNKMPVPGCVANILSKINKFAIYKVILFAESYYY